jgi:hypothetical protein
MFTSSAAQWLRTCTSSLCLNVTSPGFRYLCSSAKSFGRKQFEQTVLHSPMCVDKSASVNFQMVIVIILVNVLIFPFNSYSRICTMLIKSNIE